VGVAGAVVVEGVAEGAAEEGDEGQGGGGEGGGQEEENEVGDGLFVPTEGCKTRARVFYMYAWTKREREREANV
jgi:hypothetical protein